ncbi:hypothetical protein I1100191F8_26600 [Phocaeicola dorei]
MLNVIPRRNLYAFKFLVSTMNVAQIVNNKVIQTDALPDDIKSGINNKISNMYHFCSFLFFCCIILPNRTGIVNAKSVEALAGSDPKNTTPRFNLSIGNNANIDVSTVYILPKGPPTLTAVYCKYPINSITKEEYVIVFSIV